MSDIYVHSREFRVKIHSKFQSKFFLHKFNLKIILKQHIIHVTQCNNCNNNMLNTHEKPNKYVIDSKCI